jgi:hybrid cluster-associated redox disulfide protein
MSETIEKKSKFEADMTVRQIIEMHPEAGLVLTGYHLGGCSHCGVNQFETLQQVCNAYGIPIDAVLSSLNDLLD